MAEAEVLNLREAAAFILTMPRERLDAALDALRAELLAEDEKKKEMMK